MNYQQTCLHNLTEVQAQRIQQCRTSIEGIARQFEYFLKTMDVCLHRPMVAPYFVPVHQEAITQRRWDKEDAQEAIRLSDQAMDRYFIGLNRQYQPVDKSVYERLREFTLDKKIVYAWPPQTDKPTIADSLFGDDLPILSVEIVTGGQYLTVQRGKHRRPKPNDAVISEIGLLPYKLDQSMSFPDAGKVSFAEEPELTTDQRLALNLAKNSEIQSDGDAIDQDLKKVNPHKELR